MTSPRRSAPPEAKYRGPTVQELLDEESVPVPWVLRQEAFVNLGSEPLSADRYTSQDFFEAEVKHLWPKVWQLACLEQDIPDVGDSIVYDIVHWSFVVVRVAPGEIKAFYNSCLHRGRQLRVNDQCAQQVPELRCPFHGITWNLDGTLKYIPLAFDWDLEHVDHSAFGLPEVLVGTWDGFVFINMDANAEPLREFIGDLATHFERWPFATRWKAAHVAKVMPANWKVVTEAFLESFHVLATHPQMFAGLLGGDGSSCEYDIYGDGNANFNRMILNGPLPNPNLPYEVTEQDLIDEMFARGGIVTESGAASTDEGQGERPRTAREHMARLGGRGSATGTPYRGGPPTVVEQTSSIQYYLFPNIMPWAGSIFYRFRPLGRQHDKSIMECMLLVAQPEGKKHPRAASIHWLSEDDDWTAAPELGALAEIFNQDSGNVPFVQRGLEASGVGVVNLSAYGDSRVRHFHHLLDRFLSNSAS